MSDDGRQGITLIAFVGSVFSPYYAMARRLGRGKAEDHCALNVALYGERSKRWAMTERGRRGLSRTSSRLAIGPSTLDWSGGELIVDIDEVTFPIVSRVRGRVRLSPAALCMESYALDPHGIHRWRPIAPCARVDVELSSPGSKWSGSGYFDTNHGAAPIEDGFSRWHWSRSDGRDGTTILYDIAGRDGAHRELALLAGRDGTIGTLMPPPRAALPRTAWRIERATRSAPGVIAKVARTLEDTPFYARSIVTAGLGGGPATMMHESLDLDRFRRRLVQLMLPFRMPRRPS